MKNELVSIEAINKNTFKFTSTNGSSYTANPVNFYNDNEDIIVFSCHDSNGHYSEFRYNVSVDSRLEEALKKIGMNSNDLKDTVRNKIAERQRQVKLVKQLREETGAGMMQCKHALIKNDWIMEKAKQYIKENPIRMWI